MTDSEDINEKCPCPAECDNHGRCKLCRENHAAKGGEPFCQSSDEQTFEYG